MFPDHKTAKKFHKPRVVHLTPSTVELNRKLIARHPKEPRIRGPQEDAFTCQNTRCRFRRLQKNFSHLNHVYR